MEESSSPEPVQLGVALAAVVAVLGWTAALLWMLLPIATNNASPRGDFLPSGYVWCAPAAWDVYEPETLPGCLERRETGPARALTATHCDHAIEFSAGDVW